MQRSMLVTLALVFGALFGAGCAAAQDSPSPSKPKAWTLLIFLNGDNDLEPFALQDFLEIASVGSTPDLDVVIQFDRAVGYSNKYGDWTGTLRFHVAKGMAPEPARAIEDLGEVNMGDGASVTEFVRWGMSKYPARNTMLVVWNHGQGWRLRQAVKLAGQDEGIENAQVDALRVLSGNRLPDVPLPPGWRIPGTVRYVSSDDSSGDHLFNAELAAAIATAALQRKLAVVGFDACLMAMVETAYALRDATDFMVASEELEPGDGWNYRDLLTRWTSAPGSTPAQVATLVVESYRSHYEEVDGETTQSALQLDGIVEAAAALSRLADHLRADLGLHGSAIGKARDRVMAYAPGRNLHGVDLIRFLDELSSASTDLVARQLVDAALAAVRSLVVANYAGADRQGRFGSNGLAIYFPRTAADFHGDPDREGYLETNPVFPVAFVQQHTWDDLLRDYLGVP